MRVNVIISELCNRWEDESGRRKINVSRHEGVVDKNGQTHIGIRLESPDQKNRLTFWASTPDDLHNLRHALSDALRSLDRIERRQRKSPFPSIPTTDNHHPDYRAEANIVAAAPDYEEN